MGRPRKNDPNRCQSRWYAPNGRARALCSRSINHPGNKHWNGTIRWTTESAEKSDRLYGPASQKASA